MNKYIANITYKIISTIDETSKLGEKTTRHALFITLNRTPEGKCFELFVDRVTLRNEFGQELTRADKASDGICYTTELYFLFVMDEDFCELQNNSEFEITLHAAQERRTETFKYILSDHSWTEIDVG